MKGTFRNFTHKAVDQTRQLTDLTVNTMRLGARQAATLVAATKSPVRKVTQSGLRLNTLSHKSLEKLVKQQLHAFEAVVDDGSERLQAAAEARDLRGLVSGQIASLPATRRRVAGEARKTVAILADAGIELGRLVSDTVGGLAPARKTTARKTSTRKPARKKTAGVSRKSAPRKKAAPRATTKAAVVKPAVIRSAPAKTEAA